MLIGTASRPGAQIKTLALDGCYFATQLVTYPFDWLAALRIGLTISVPEGLSIPPGTLILSNHLSKLDPFLITGILGTKSHLSLAPLRYPTTPDYARRPILGRFLQTLGAYDVGQTPIERAKKLLYTRDLLDRGCTVLLFPEGRIVENEPDVSAFMDGAKMLFARDYPTLFVRLSGFKTQSFLNLKKSERARLRVSPILRGDATTKAVYMQRFFSEPA